MTVPSMLDKALRLAARGFRVFPLAMNGKTPALDAGWKKLATADPARITSMWTCPVEEVALDYNIGIALDPDTLVVDVDVRGEKVGGASLRLFEAIYEPLPTTYTVRSASGGQHHYYRTMDSGAFPKELAKDIDLKGNGGYVVGPGSMINGAEYTIEVDVPASDLPESIEARRDIRERRQSPAGAEPLAELDTESAIGRAREWLTTQAPDAVEGAGGDAVAYRVAARVKDFGVSEEACLQLLEDHWDERNSPPWGDELAEKVRNAYAYGQNPPGIRNPEAEFEPVEIDRAEPNPDLPLQWVRPFDADSIPRRRWVLGRFMARQYLTGLISPPGVGKTTFLLTLAVAVATGRDDITGFKVHERTRVLLWNQEDEHDELNRRLLAIMAAYNVEWPDLDIDGKPGLVMGSGVDRALLFAKRTNSNTLAASKDAAAVEAFILDNGIGAVVLDPFVELHQADENNNVEVAAVARVFRRIAVRGHCAVVLAHHSRKPREADAALHAGNMDSGRGAGALNGVARMVATLYTLDKDTGKRFGIREEDCRRYVRFDDAKNNLGLVAAEPTFFRREGVTIGGFGGEEVGVLRPATLTRVEDPKMKAREDLIRDIADLMRPGETILLGQLARDLTGLALRSEEKPRTLETNIRRALEKPTNTTKGILGIYVRGRKQVVAMEPCDSATGADSPVAEVD